MRSNFTILFRSNLPHLRRHCHPFSYAHSIVSPQFFPLLHDYIASPIVTFLTSTLSLSLFLLVCGNISHFKHVLFYVDLDNGLLPICPSYSITALYTQYTWQQNYILKTQMRKVYSTHSNPQDLLSLSKQIHMLQQI